MNLNPDLLRFQQVTATVLTAALMIAPAVAQAPAQQVQQPQQPPAKNNPQGLYKFKIESELVLINVVARDKQGKPVTDLKAGDFTMLDEGQPMRIGSSGDANVIAAPVTACSRHEQECVQWHPAGKSPAFKPICPLQSAENPMNNKLLFSIGLAHTGMEHDETLRA